MNTAEIEPSKTFVDAKKLLDGGEKNKSTHTTKQLNNNQTEDDHSKNLPVYVEGQTGYMFDVSEDTMSNKKYQYYLSQTTGRPL